MPVAPQVVMAVIAVYSATEQHKSAVAQHDAARQERRMAAAQNLRERKQAYRQMVVQQAQMQAAGTNLGAGMSSGLQGGLSALGSSTYSNIGFQGQMEASNQQRLSYLDKAARHISNANIAQTVGNAASLFIKPPAPPAPPEPTLDVSGGIRTDNQSYFTSRTIG